MRASPFRGIPSMQQIECSASPLESDADLYSMAIFRLDPHLDRHREGAPMASLRPWKDECLTSSSFSSCHVDRRNVRHTKLRTIVPLSQLGRYGERRQFGCNVTYSRRNGAMRKLSWTIAVESEYSGLGLGLACFVVVVVVVVVVVSGRC